MNKIEKIADDKRYYDESSFVEDVINKINELVEAFNQTQEQPREVTDKQVVGFVKHTDQNRELNQVAQAIKEQEEWERELRFTYGHLYYQNEEGEFCQIVNEIDDLIEFISQLLSEKEKEAKQEVLRELSYEIDGIKLNKLIDENQEYLNKVGKSLLKQIKLLKEKNENK